MRSPGAQTGFSLLELIVVLVVLALGAALIVPRIGGSPSADAAAAERLILAGLRQARSLAVTRGDSVAWVLDTERARMHLELGGQAPGSPSGTAPRPEPSSGPPSDPGLGALTRGLPGAVSLELVTAAREQVSEQIGRIRFFPDGSSTGGRIKTSAGGRTQWVDVDWLTGRIRVLVDESG